MSSNIQELINALEGYEGAFPGIPDLIEHDASDIPDLIENNASGPRPVRIEDLPREMVIDILFDLMLERALRRMDTMEQTTSWINPFHYDTETAGNDGRTFYIRLQKPVSITETKEKPIDKNNECPITYDEIKEGDAYLSCGSCHYNFGEEAIIKHLNDKYGDERCCPMCRSNWTDYCKHINKATKAPIDYSKYACLNTENYAKNYKLRKSVNNGISLLTGKPVKTKYNKNFRR